jgi:hypothetical protein
VTRITVSDGRMGDYACDIHKLSSAGPVYVPAFFLALLYFANPY